MDHSRTTISLAESLTLKSVPELRTLAKGYAIKGTSRMRKADLVQAVHSALTKPQRLEELLYVMAGPSWALFQMCIRDRRRTSVASAAVNASIINTSLISPLGGDILYPKGLFVVAQSSVSYTHLDVYKRQPLNECL